MALRDLENLVHAALNCGLIGPQQRQALMRGLPMGFVYSLPTVSRPIDQLRFDLMELERTPRLIGLDRPPLAVWLSNAADITAAQGKAEAARLFAGEADRLAPGGVGEKTEAALRRTSVGASAPTSDASTAAQSVRAKRTHVLTLDSAGPDGWKTVQPPIEPVNTFSVAIPTGDWAHTTPPHTARWRQVRDRLDTHLDALRGLVRPDDRLAVFVRGIPSALAILAAARIRKMLPLVEPVFYGPVRKQRRNRWLSWEPAPAAGGGEPSLSARASAIADDSRALSVVVEVSGRFDPQALERATRPLEGAARLTLSHPAPHGGSITEPAHIGQVVEAFHDALQSEVGPRPALRRLHLFYAGPGALAMHLAEDLIDLGRAVTVYAQQSRGFVPAVELSPSGDATLVQPKPAAAEGDTYDAFIAYASPDEALAYELYDALAVERGMRVFLDARSLVPGDTWTTSIPAALARSRVVIALISPHSDRAWYQSEELIQAIRHTRRAVGERRLIPVLFDGMKRDELPYGLQRLTAITVPDGLPIDETSAYIVAALPGLPGASAVARGASAGGAANPSDSERPSADRAAPQRPRQAPKHLKILFIAADPGRSDRQVLSDEVRHIDRAIRMNGARRAVTIASRHALRLDDLIRALREEAPDLLHVAGHGDSRGIHLIDPETARAVAIGPEAFARIIALFRDIRGVVLNTPESDGIARALTGTVDFAIGLSGVPSDKARLDLIGGFYDAITGGESVSRAFKAAEALFSSRRDARGTPRLESDADRVDLDALVLVAPG